VFLISRYMRICMLYIKCSDDGLFAKSKHVPFVVYRLFQLYTHTYIMKHVVFSCYIYYFLAHLHNRMSRVTKLETAP